MCKLIGKMLLGGLVIVVTSLLVAGLHVALVIGYVWGWLTILAALFKGECDDEHDRGNT